MTIGSNLAGVALGAGDHGHPGAHVHPEAKVHQLAVGAKARQISRGGGGADVGFPRQKRSMGGEILIVGFHHRCGGGCGVCSGGGLLRSGDCGLSGGIFKRLEYAHVAGRQVWISGDCGRRNSQNKACRAQNSRAAGNGQLAWNVSGHGGHLLGQGYGDLAAGDGTGG